MPSVGRLVTAQAVPTERRAGSRSSSVVVVTNACGSAAIRRTRCERRSGSSSEKTSSSRRSGGRPSSAVSRSSSASLNARIAVRCWPRDANDASGRPPISNTMSSRCGPDQRRAVPDLLVGGLGEAAGQGVADRLARVLRRVRRVRDARGGPAAASSGAISAWAAARGAARSPPAAGAAPRGRPCPASSSGRVPEPQLGAGRLLLADEPQQAVALLEGPAVGGEVPARRRASAGRPAGRGPPGAATGEPATSSISSGANSTVRSTPASDGGAARDAVHADPLAGAAAGASARARPRRRRASSGGASGRPDPRLDAGQLPAPADELALGARAVRAAPGQQDDRLEQARLAGRVGAPDQLRARARTRRRAPRSRAGRGPRGPRRIGASGRRVGARWSPGPSGGRPDGHHDVDVVRVAHRPEDARREGPVELEREPVRRRRCSARR